MKKSDLYQGLKVKTFWKEKLFIGLITGIPKIEAEKSAKITHGRFILIPILMDNGRIIQMPYSSKLDYERI